jgi:sigma-B regulation protein RsbU (phosphoserine phosphatase)
MQLHEDDRLFLFSDGIYEAPASSGELWGRHRLQATLDALRTSSIERCIQETMMNARRWLGGEIFPDDVALVGLEISEGPVRGDSDLA